MISTEQRVRAPGVRRPPGRLAAWQINRVIAYIDANLAAAINARDLATVANLSSSHFFRGFKASTGLTPFEHVAQRRVELALKLMRTTHEPLSQIAIQCGLCDQSHLCRLFRRLVGQTPAAWRRANVSGPQRAQLAAPTPRVSPVGQCDRVGLSVCAMMRSDSTTAGGSEEAWATLAAC